jgi:carbonic anhydrase
VIVTGHYGCGGVQAAVEDKRHGLIDNWLRHIQDIASLYHDLLGEIADPSARLDKLCELNVIEQVINTSETTIVQDAWSRNQDLTVHGLIYSLSDGILRDLNVSVDGRFDRRELRRQFVTDRSASTFGKS